jgi:hypothetical protein
MFVADPLDVELKINDHDNCCGVIMVLPRTLLRDASGISHFQRLL